MIACWKHLAMALLLGSAAALASAQQPASVPAVAPANPAVQPAQPFANVVSESVFDLPRRDLAKEAQDQTARRVTQLATTRRSGARSIPTRPATRACPGWRAAC